jgi:hypothetical protein
MRTKLKNKIHSIIAMNGTSISYAGTTTTNYGDWGWNISQVSEQVLEPYIVPVHGLLLLTAIAAIAGGILVYFKR